MFQKTSLPHNYNLLKELTINTGSVNDFISYMAVYFLGAGEWALGGFLFLLYIALGNIQYRFWYKSIECGGLNGK